MLIVHVHVHVKTEHIEAFRGATESPRTSVKYAAVFPENARWELRGR